jgi:cysteine-rich repeat protein
MRIRGFDRALVSVALLMTVLASLQGQGEAQGGGRSTIRQYYFCLGGELEGFACQGLADVTTCGEGSQCIEDIYVDACGNGYRMQVEECDDGNTVTGDGCSANCTVELGWACAGATDREPDMCEVVCGDGKQLDSGCCTDDELCSRECSSLWGCDDGNLVDGDGCSKTCSVESGYDCWRGDIESYSPCLCTRTRVSASTAHTCAIDSNSKIKCWGDPTNDKTANYFDPNDGAYAWPRGSWSVQPPQSPHTQVHTHKCTRTSSHTQVRTQL